MTSTLHINTEDFEKNPEFSEGTWMYLPADGTLSPEIYTIYKTKGKSRYGMYWEPRWAISQLSGRNPEQLRGMWKKLSFFSSTNTKKLRYKQLMEGKLPFHGLTNPKLTNPKKSPQ